MMAERKRRSEKPKCRGVSPTWEFSDQVWLAGFINDFGFTRCPLSSTEDSSHLGFWFTNDYGPEIIYECVICESQIGQDVYGHIDHRFQDVWNTFWELETDAAVGLI